ARHVDARSSVPQRSRARHHRQQGAAPRQNPRSPGSLAAAVVRVGLRTSIATPAGKQRYVRTLFATIADRYDFITVFLSCGMDRRWKERLIALAALTPRDRVLDLACGTGDIVFRESSRARYAVGLDVTHRMLQLAAAKPEGGATRLIQGDMLALPFRNAAFDVVTVGYGLRN